jgi:hypothetical protein
MPLTEEIKVKNRERSRLFYQNEENKVKHSNYMRNYHRENRLLLKEYKKMLKEKPVDIPTP